MASEHFVSNRDVSVRMFRNGFLEAVSRVHPAVPHLLYVPLVVWTLARSTAGVGSTALLFALGLLLWTLAEYLLHRWAFHAPDDIMAETHRVAESLRGRPDEPVLPALPGWRHRLYFISHGVHHEYPADSTRLVAPPSASVPIAIVTWLVFRAVAGPVLAPGVYAGFVTGYLVYDTTHYLVHHEGLPTRLGRWLKRRHARHHFVDHEHDYGVSSPLWDYIFGTDSRRPTPRS